ncbi:FAD-binding oxidoreductase [Acidisoma cellulosilytica]|uniref:FAD-binding oxidoreductase n=1 Tax=Acidisoma cellulosilyticum TaxID=2802395 RepID=A0A964E660_9PROT|nr:FAD-binding oxidoreductase [Acidisoma cellulosilyticum]MCB8883380.1 FAD-binding oxidoreductase [Acidisoma cellulosilyticum]
MTTSPLHVAVLGAGIFGVSTAVHLLREGARVTLVTETQPSSGASGRSLSWLNSARKRSLPYHQLRIAGIDRYRTLSAHLPNAPWLRFDGALTWDADDASNEIADVYAHERGLGYDSRLLTPAEVTRITPGVNLDAITPQGAIFNPGEGWVDLPSLIAHLLAEFTLLGGKLITEAGKTSILTTGGRAQGLRLAEGQVIEADRVVLATGPAVPAMAAELGITIGDDTPISLLIKTRPLFSNLKAVLNTPRIAVRPTPDGALVLDSGWSEQEIVIHGEGRYEAKESTIQGLLDEASKVLEGQPRLHFERFGMGPKPIPGDGEPVVGALASLPGAYTAFSHSGATLGLIIGELLAYEIVTGTEHSLLSPFRPGRFSA